MRKAFWCCTALGLLAAAGLYVAAGRSNSSSDSLLTRCLVNSVGIAGAIQNIWAPDQRKEDYGVVVNHIPADPTPCPPAPAAEKSICEKVMEAIQLPADPNPPPASIVIHEEVPQAAPPPAAGKEETSEWQKVEPKDAEVIPTPPSPLMSDLATGPAPCPDVMPYASEDGEPAQAERMPYAAGDESQEPTSPQPEDRSDADKAAQPSEPQNAPECKEDPNYHHHYSGCPSTTCCPYTGRCYPSTPSYQPSTPKTGGQDESSEPKAKKKKHTSKKQPMGLDNENCPTHPEVDTMEYRKSDGGLNEYGPGPF